MKIIVQLIVFFILQSVWSQTKVSGKITDKSNQPIPFANVVFKGSNEGVVANEDGHFYIESAQQYSALLVASIGFSDKEISLDKSVNYNFVIQLNEIENLKEVVLFTGKTSKKKNPALDILRKIWEHKRKNGLNIFDQYQMEKYENIIGIGSGGNINKLFSISGAKAGKSISYETLKDIYKEMEPLAIDERMKKYTIKEDRAEVIVPALTIYNAICKWAAVSEIHVPKIGLADGLIHHLYDMVIHD